MLRLPTCLTVAIALICSTANADAINARILKDHILPGYAELELQAQRLSLAAAEDCTPTSPKLRGAFHDGFDAWLQVSHLRFGPSEVDNRAFAFSFWPDPRSKRRKALNQLIRNHDSIVEDAEAFKTVSIAGRGFYALEFLLFGEPTTEFEGKAYHCSLVQAVARDIAMTASDLNSDWQTRFAARLLNPGEQPSPYKSDLEVRQELFKALSTGLQFASEARLGRPLGTFGRPRPKRAEARLSQRPLRNLTKALQGQQDLAKLISTSEPTISQRIDAAFEAVDLAIADVVDDPAFASVADIRGRLRVEIVQQRIDAIRSILREDLGPALGVSKGFNALDGD